MKKKLPSCILVVTITAYYARTNLVMIETPNGNPPYFNGLYISLIFERKTSNHTKNSNSHFINMV